MTDNTITLDIGLGGAWTVEGLRFAADRCNEAGIRNAYYLLSRLAGLIEAKRPPRPEEPTGLGAVVEDAEGVRWVSWRSGLAQHDRPWQRLEMDTDEFRDYRDIAAVAVLFDGADQ